MVGTGSRAGVARALVVAAMAVGGGLGAWVGVATAAREGPGVPSPGGAPTPSAGRIEGGSTHAQLEALARRQAPARARPTTPAELAGTWRGVVVAVERVGKDGVSMPADATQAPPLEFRIVAEGPEVELLPQGPGLRRRVLDARDGRVVGRGDPPFSLTPGLEGGLVGVAESRGFRIEFHATRTR